MFGLMKYCRCASSEEERIRYRRHYCGVCKTLGKMYGAHTRFLLNRDLVFLSELLTEVSGDPFETQHWNRPAAKIYQCLSLPPMKGDIPLFLQIAATYNVLITGYKLDDNIADAKKPLAYFWRIGRKGLSKALTKSRKQVETWDYPLRNVDWWMEEQRRREATGGFPQDSDRALSYFAEPSAVTTGLSMKYGVIIVNRDERQDTMYALGYAFGKLIYLLDALEDFEWDAKNGEFNAIRAAYHIVDERLPHAYRQKIIEKTHTLRDEMRQAFIELHLSDDRTRHFTQHLNVNLNRTLGQNECRPRSGCDAARQTVKRMNLREKWTYAKEQARNVALSFLPGTFLTRFKAHAAFFLVFWCVLTMPQSVLAAFIVKLETTTTHNPDCLNWTFVLTWFSLIVSAAFRRPSFFRLTKQSFDELRNAQVSKEILAALEVLRGRKFDAEEDFINAIRNRVGEEQTELYREQFVRMAVPRRKKRASRKSADAGGSSSDCLCCCDCCHCLYCFPESCEGCDGVGDGCDCGGCDCCGDCDCGGCDCDCG